MEWTNQIGWSDIIGYVIGIASLWVSWLAFSGIKKLEKKYLLAGTLNHIVSNLKELEDKIVDLILQYYKPNQQNDIIFRELNKCIAEIKPYLSNLLNYKLFDNEIRASQDILTIIDKIISGNNSLNKIESYTEIQNKLITFVGDLELLENDNKLRQ